MDKIRENQNPGVKETAKMEDESFLFSHEWYIIRKK